MLQVCEEALQISSKSVKAGSDGFWLVVTGNDWNITFICPYIYIYVYIYMVDHTVRFIHETMVAPL